MRDMNAENVTQVVLDSYAGVTDERLKEILGELIPRLHDLIRAVKLTPAEWKTAVDFLQVAGKVTSDQRNEFILLSDLLGVSAVVDLVDGDTDEGATMGTLLGPFYVPGHTDMFRATLTCHPAPTSSGITRASRSSFKGRSAVPTASQSLAHGWRSGRTARLVSTRCKTRTSRTTICAAPCMLTRLAAIVSRR